MKATHKTEGRSELQVSGVLIAVSRVFSERKNRARVQRPEGLAKSKLTSVKNINSNNHSFSMKKLKLYGIKKGETHNVFHIEKSESFLELFREFLHTLGFKKHTTAIELLKLLGDSDDNYSAKKYSNELYRDKYFYFGNEEFKIDVFFGKERVIVSIFTSSDNQNKITELMMKFCK